MMMWLEALLSALLVLLIISLTFQSVPASNPMLEFYSYQQLQERALGVVEIESSADASDPISAVASSNALSSLFADSAPFCYSLQWDGESPKVFGAPSCVASLFSASSTPLRSISLGAFKEGKLRLLTLQQTAQK